MASPPDDLLAAVRPGATTSWQDGAPASGDDWATQATQAPGTNGHADPSPWAGGPSPARPGEAPGGPWADRTMVRPGEEPESPWADRTMVRPGEEPESPWADRTMVRPGEEPESPWADRTMAPADGTDSPWAASASAAAPPSPASPPTSPAAPEGPWAGGPAQSAQPSPPGWPAGASGDGWPAQPGGPGGPPQVGLGPLTAQAPGAGTTPSPAYGAASATSPFAPGRDPAGPDLYGRPNPAPAVPPTAYPHPQGPGGYPSGSHAPPPGYVGAQQWGGPPRPPGASNDKFRPGVGLVVGILGIVALVLSLTALPWAESGGLELKVSDMDSAGDLSAPETGDPADGYGAAPGESAGPAQADPMATTSTTTTFNTVSPPLPSTVPASTPADVPDVAGASDQWRIDYLDAFGTWGWIAVIAVASVAVLFSTLLVPASHGGRMGTGFLTAGILGLLINAVDRRGSVGPRLSGALGALVAGAYFGGAGAALYGGEFAPDMAIGWWAGVAGLALVFVGCLIGTRRTPATA